MGFACASHGGLGARVGALMMAGVAAVAVPHGAAYGAESEELSRLSLQQLTDIQVTSVSKAPQLLSAAPASIYVITQQDIQRSGVTSLADALRLAPNLRLTQMGSNRYSLSARGFSTRPDVQSFSNKLLMLIDGRSVYSPLFSGIDLDVQDVMLSDVARIEVISGPGATLWGANAVNGVINVITQPSYLTEGAALVATAGNDEQDVSLRYGGSLGSNGDFRVYGKAFERDAMERLDGSSAGDSWSRAQGGFRMDFTRGSGTLTFQGDVYDGSNEKAGSGSQSTSGANLLGRWQVQAGRSSLQLQTYFDHVDRGAPSDGIPYVVNTWDVEAQQGLPLGTRNQLVWGAGARVHDYHIHNSASLLFEPSASTMQVWNLFAQDTISLTPALKLTLGLKLEHSSYTNWEPQPDARLAWQASDSTLLWATTSRAIRAPTPFDADVIERVGDLDFLRGNRGFVSERVTAYELGIRSVFSSKFSMSASTFYNHYDDLRSIEPADADTFLPLRWGNGLAGHTFGMTAWASWQVADWWKLSPGLALLRKRLHFQQDASGLIGTSQSGNDPQGHGLLNSAMNLGEEVTLDISVRHVAKLPEPELPAYTELTARLAWQLSRSWELSVRGVNLLHEGHQEYPDPDGVVIGRSAMAEVRWRP